MLEEGAKRRQRQLLHQKNNGGIIELPNCDSSNEMISLMSCFFFTSFCPDYACLVDEDVFRYGVLLY